MSQKSFAIPVVPSLVRKLQDPTNKDVSRTVGYCSFEHLPFTIPMDPNPRTPTPKSLKSTVAKDIRESASGKLGMFHLVNAGISILADSVEFNNEKGLLTFVVDTEKGHGLYNGGHTLRILEEVIQNGFEQSSERDKRQYCNFDIQVNVPGENLGDIAEGRNSAVALKDKTKEEYKDSFEWIKSALAGKPYYDKIGYVESHDKPEDIEKVICKLTAMNPILYGKDDYPIIAYSSKKRCFDLFVEKPDAYTPLAPILPDVLEFYEHLIAKAYPHYLEHVPNGKFLRFEGMVKQLTRKTDTLPFTQEQVEYRVADGCLIPLLAAFRCLIDTSSGKASWIVAPEVIYKRIGGRLIRILYATNKTFGSNPNAVGKNENVYRQLYGEVESELKSYLLEQFKGQQS